MFWSKKETQRTHYEENAIIVKENELTELSNALASNNPKALQTVSIPSESPLYPLFTILQQAENKRLESSQRALMDINGRVGRITGISSIRNMIKVIEEQAGDVNNMAAQAEEMSAAATEIATTTDKAALFVEQSLETASGGVQKVKKAISLVDRSFSDFEETNKQVHEVLKYMGEIEVIIELIAGVADQTNLLALNAAIEAARAGEQGRGFAVVADEVRKLAEDTKSSVTTIKDKIGFLNQESNKTTQSILQVAKNMEAGKNTLQQAETSIEQILGNINSIAEDIRQIATGNEEQSSTLQNFGQIITGFASSAENTLVYARDAGQGIYQISEELIDLRQRRVTQATNLSQKQALEVFLTDHLSWTWKIYNMLLGYETIDEDSLESSETCRLGKWLLEQQKITDTEKLELVHRQVHRLGKEAVLAYNNKDSTKVEKLWGELSLATNELISELNEFLLGVKN